MNETTFLLELAKNNQIFSIALSIVFIVGTLEMVFSLVGASISSLFEGILPDIDIPDTDTDNFSSFADIFSWLNKGRVPLIMIFLIFLTFFGLSGLIIQAIAFYLKSSYLFTPVAVIIAFIVTLPLTRLSSVFLAKIMPRDETTVVSTNSFIGETCEIVLGTATYEKFVEAKIKDQFNETHYIMVKAANEGESFHKGDKVFIKSKINNKKFTVIAMP